VLVAGTTTVMVFPSMVSGSNATSTLQTDFDVM
jgi:hypothetical protein